MIRYHLFREYSNIVDWHYCFVVISHRGKTFEQAVELLKRGTLAARRDNTTFIAELPNHELHAVELDCSLQY